MTNTCQGCKYDIPGDCAKREWVDGWLKFPEGDCYTTEETEVLALLEVVKMKDGRVWV